ncbi:hypothetical protein FOMPIDRAFT_84401 [Fomitopsis schrenkii]|uniref:F-box domain-containing protein n=1 Tax=Fomitopsis schrenkii TaxID=2126942 RepID=S8FGF1_FOMSC|nr:hypothetical protein FOMPIDRAFT_84401 [Fomitopsis schrenkii]
MPLPSSVKLEALLTEQPDILPLVRDLTLTLALRELSWLSVFTKLTTLEIMPTESSFDPKDPIIIKLTEDFRLPSVTTLSITNFYPSTSIELALLLACFPNVLALTVGTEDEGDEDVVEDLQEEVLPKSLPLAVSHLRKLTYVDSLCIQILPMIMRSTGTSLEYANLVLWVPPRWESLSRFLDFSTNTHLVRLSLKIDIPPDDGWTAYLAAALTHLSSSHTSLRQITLTPIIRHHVFLGDPGEALGIELARVLAELPNLTVTFCEWIDFSDAQTDLRKKLRLSCCHLTAYTQRLRWGALCDLELLDDDGEGSASALWAWPSMFISN